jgi:hypothetical protein
LKSKKKPLGFWEVLTEFPPYYVRCLAKNPKPGRGADLAISDADIAIVADLEINRVREISRMTDWKEVRITEFLAFTTACNFDPTDSNDRRRAYQYEYICTKRKVVPFGYLRSSPKWESEFLPLVKIIMSRLRS